jgi:hypothetical protein
MCQVAPIHSKMSAATPETQTTEDEDHGKADDKR